MPVLTVEEIRAVELYIRDNYESVMEQDRRIRERAAARRQSPEIEEAKRIERRKRLENVRQQIQTQKQERNGDPAAAMFLLTNNRRGNSVRQSFPHRQYPRNRAIVPAVT